MPSNEPCKENNKTATVNLWHTLSNVVPSIVFWEMFWLPSIVPWEKFCLTSIVF